jgi:hypothetical protein
VASRGFIIENMFRYFIFLLLGILLFLGGLGVNVALVQYLGILVGLALLVEFFVRKRKMRLPDGIGFYLIFLLALGASTLWHQGRQVSLGYLALFVGGGIFWLTFYNFKDKVRERLLWSIIFLGLAFGGLYAVNWASGEMVFGYQSLFLPNTPYLQHNHLGDFWAVVLVVAAYFLLRYKKWWAWGLIGLGGYFLMVSLSRSAYVALAAGIIYLFRGRYLTVNKKFLWFFLCLALTLFLFAGTYKTLIFSRPYFVQAVLGIIHNPFGVGMGSFYLVSSDPANQRLGMHGLSGFTHNIVLEFMVGMGFLGLIFVAWVAKVTLNLLKDKDPKNLPFQAIFITLGVNFLFDYTYIIPTMAWLWFMALGLSYENGGKVLASK